MKAFRVVLVLMGVLLAAPAVATAFRMQDRSRVRGCANNLSQLWKMQNNYMVQYGGAHKLLPLETGDAFWLKLSEPRTRLIPESLKDIYQCPVEGKVDAGCDYRGPAWNVNKFKDGDPVGADVDGNHGIGRGGNVLRKSGDVQTVGPADVLWAMAAKKTTGGNRAIPPAASQEENPDQLEEQVLEAVKKGLKYVRGLQDKGTDALKKLFRDFTKDEDKPKVKPTMAVLRQVEMMLEEFKMEHLRYPERLRDLSRRPSYIPESDWTGPYWEGEPKDGWGRPILYQVPGREGNPYYLYSLGADGERGGTGFNADLGKFPEKEKGESTPSEQFELDRDGGREAPEKPRKETPKKPEKGAPFFYTEWNAWNGFGEGSSVTYQIQNTDRAKVWVRYTILRKENDKITLKNELMMDLGGKEGKWKAGTPDPKIVRKPAEAAAGGADATCPRCEKKYSDHDAPTWEDGKADVAGNEVATKTMVMKDCKTGDETKVMTVSTDVPGWMTKLGQGPVTAFEAK